MTLDDVIKKLNLHIETSDAVHADLAVHDAQVAKRQTFIIDSLFGEPREDIDGEIVRSGGRLEALEDKVEELWSAQRNGGLRIHIPWVKLLGVISAVLVAVVGAAGAIIVAIIENT